MIHVAVDIGASSGSVNIGILRQNQFHLEEIHRFPNGFKELDGTLCWDMDHLLQEILIGLEKVKKKGYDHCTLGIDTWGVDYALIDQKGNRIKEIVSYRDHRTDRTMDTFTKLMSREKIYDLTGIQFLPFNTIYQLFEEEKEVLKKTDKILLVPDYLNYCLTGKMALEATNVSTTQLFEAHSRTLSEELLAQLHLSEDQFPPLVEPGDRLGDLRRDFFPEKDLPEAEVIHVASHDTASAVVGTPGDDQETWAFLSSGTWSLLGMELEEPIIHEQSRVANYTNEWGAFQTYRFLKNIMGLWVIQEVRRLLPQEYSYGELVEMAKEVEPFQQYIDLNDERFLNPTHMIDEIQAYCQETAQTVPKTPGEIAQAVYSNLAIIYALELENLERLTKKTIDALYIVGGGTQNELLNQLTANVSQKKVIVGPSEATAIGNLLMQMMTTGKVKDLQEGRELLRTSFGFQASTPEPFDGESYKATFKSFLPSH